MTQLDAIEHLTDIEQQGRGGNAFGAQHVTIGYNALGQWTNMTRYESLAVTNLVWSTQKKEWCYGAMFFVWMITTTLCDTIGETTSS